MEMGQHTTAESRLTVPVTKPRTKEEAEEKKAFWVTILGAVALIAFWAGATVFYGLSGFILVAVGFVPVVFIILIKLTLG